MSHSFQGIFSNRYLLACFFLVVSQASQTQELELLGIGSYNEFNNTTMVVKVEVGQNSSNSIEVRERFSFRIIEQKPVRRWYQFWSQNLSLNNSVVALTNHIDDLLLMSEVLQGSLEPGDLVEFERSNDNSMIMRLNGVALTAFKNAEFYDFLLTAFTGRVPPSSILKQQLLGENTDTGPSITLFNSLSYDSPREQVIWSWVDAMEAKTDVAAAQTVAPQSNEVIEVEAIASAPAIATPAIVAPDPSVAEEAQRQAVQAQRREAEQLALQSQRRTEESRRLALESLVATQRHLQSVRNRVNANMDYPRSAIRRNHQGTVRVSLMLNRDGSIYSVELVEDCEHDSLNTAAIEGVRAAAPFDPIPSTVQGDQALAEFPVTFALQ